MIKVYPCGTDVTITQGGCIGKISCFSVRYGTVTYEVTYYIDGVRQVVSPLHECEFQVQASTKKVGIGYK